VVEVELHQLTLRYERLRKRHPRAERALLSSLAEIGQQTPVVVVGEAERFVLIDGYKRVRALRRLARDVVLVTRWELEEVEALLLERGLRRGSEDALDQAWLLAELQERFGYSLEELARRFEHSKSWVSGRLALIQCLPGSVQEQVRLGALSAHAAMKYLVPMARTEAAAAEKLAAAIVPLKPTTREVATLYAGWQSGSTRTRELILCSPKLYLEAKAHSSPAPPSATQRLLDDLGALGGIARRALRALQDGLLQQLLESERLELGHAFARAKADLQRLIHRIELESGHVG
jgi:ParB family transcriptional regulator, chromosome partitioning protein